MKLEKVLSVLNRAAEEGLLPKRETHVEKMARLRREYIQRHPEQARPEEGR